MIETKWTLQLQISDGPRFNYTGSILMEGLNRIDVVVPANESRLVKVSSSELKDVKLFFVVRTDKPQAAEPKNGANADDEKKAQKRVLYYTIVGGSGKEIYLSNNEADIPLADVETPELHVVLGPGAIDLLCDPPNELCFTNEGAEDATITIIICREASSDCEEDADEDDDTEQEDTEQEDDDNVYQETGYKDQDSSDRDRGDDTEQEYKREDRGRRGRQQSGS